MVKSLPERFLMPQEVEVLYILPAIRKAFAKALKREGLLQKAIAELLHVTEAAVSQYFSGKRAGQVAFDRQTKRAIASAAKRVMREGNFLLESQRILELVHKKRVVCTAHHKLGGVPRGCDACYVCSSQKGGIEFNIGCGRKARLV
jgi:predicted transcriptional regulator